MLMPSIFGENMIDDLFDDFTRPARFHVSASNVMKTDVKETDGGYELGLELPGYKKEDVQAQLKDGYLTITAKTDSNNDTKDEDGTYIRRERYSGSCSRSFYVGEQVEQGDIKAKFEDGILKVFVPKKEAAPEVEESKYITIEG
jgi:HSP20 family molecular chaperone IbpA